MRIIKDFPNTNIEDKFYDVNAPIGILIRKLKHSLGDVEAFIGLLKEIVYWDYPKISLWAFDDILNYIDSLLATISDENRLITILNFLKILVTNSFHKDIFSSFDRLEQIFRQTTSIQVKNCVIEIYFLFSEIKKTIMNNYIEFISQCSFVVPLRPIFTDFLLTLKNCGREEEKKKAFDEFYMEYEKLFIQIIKDAKKLIENTTNQSRRDSNLINNSEINHCDNLKIDESEFKRLLRKLLFEKNENLKSEKFQEIKTILENSFNINSEKLINPGLLIKEEELGFNLYMTFSNFFVYSSYLNQNININLSSENLIELSKFTLNMLNLLIFTQKNSKIPLISEYYIEKYLKDVLEILTSKYSQDLKSVFLMSTIGFVTYFDGYENILFQNGLFHSILSDMTTPKLHNLEVNHELEVLSYEESIDQDFFNAVLLFLYKTSSFKEIPVQFLDKVLELPKDNVYPYRIDNVIFSLKKKRTLDENTLNDLVIPRLIYELNNFWVDENELNYMTAEKKNNQSSLQMSDSNLHGLTFNYKKFPSIYERSYLIQKLFKILSSIFEHNTNSSSLRYYESKIINAIDQYIKTLYTKLDELDEVKGSLFEPLLTSCIDFISKICYFLPSKIPSLIEMATLSNIFEYLSRRIPAQPNVLNLIFHIFATVQLTEDGSKFLQENEFGVKVFDKLFETILTKDEYFLSNVFNQHGFYTDDFYSPYTYFLRVENVNNILVHFFKKVHQSIDWLKNKLEKIFRNEDSDLSINDILNTKHPNLNTCRFSNRIHLIGQFFMNITQEEKEQLTKNNLIPLEDLVLNYFELVFHPLNLYMLNSTVISTTMVKGVFMNNPEKLLERLYELMTINMNVLNIQDDLINNSSNESEENNKMLIDEPKFNPTPLHKDKIISKLVHLVEFTIKKLFNLLKDKSIIHKFITRLSVIMIYLVKRQSNLSIYLSPINDCGLIINRKWNYKFLSSKLNYDLRQNLIQNIRKKEKYGGSTIIESSTENIANNHNNAPSNFLIFDELSGLEIKYKQSFQTNMRVEIVDGNNPFSTELIDNLSKIIINSHMPIIDFYITIGKSIKKNFKSFTQADLSIVKCWSTLTQSLVLVLSSLHLDEKLQHFRQIFENKADESTFKINLREVIETFIYYINILNNINIVISDKVISCYVIIQFVKLGGVNKIFEICLFLLKFTNNLQNITSNNEYPLLLLLLIKNLWNIITSIITRIIKINFENIQNLNLILIKEGFTSAFDFSCYLKSQIAWIIYNRFLNAEMPLKKIATLSYSFHSLIYTIFDVCITQWKEVISKDSEDEMIIQDVISMGFKRGEVIAALLEGKKKSDDIINFITTSNKVNEESKNNSENNENSNETSQALKLSEFINQNDFDKESFENLKNEFSKYLNVNDCELNIKLELNKNGNNPLFQLNTRNNLKENFSELFSKIYIKLIEEDISDVKISQLRKMNVLFRIREVQNQINNLNEKILIPFLKEIFVLERENCIELQSKDLQENLEDLKKLLQNRMLINYIIIKDRSKAADIFENLDIDQIGEFFEEFKVVENSLMTIRFILNSIDAEKIFNETNNLGISKKSNFSDEFINNIRNIIYECLFVIHLSLHFVIYYNSIKKNEKLNLDLNKYKKEYIEVLFEIIETQNRMILSNPELIFLDEQNLIIIFCTIVESFDFDQVLQEFVEKGGLRNLLKLRKSQNTNYDSFNDAKFKSKVVLDEAFRAFIFKIFEDEKIIERNVEMIIRYIFANVYNSKTESSYANAFRNKKQKANSQDQPKINNENSENEMESQIKSDDERNVNSNNNFSNSLNNNNNATNYKSNIESAGDADQSMKTAQPTIEINFDDFMGIIYPIMPKNKEILISVLKKFCVLDKKIEKQIKSNKKKKTSSNTSEDVQVMIKLKQENNNSIIQLANEMKNQIVREKDLNEDEDLLIQINKDNINNNNNLQHTPTKTKKDPQTIFKESSRKQIENQISNITKQFSQNMVNVINTIINQLWNLTTDMEKEIEKSFSEINSNVSKFNLSQRYIIDLDSLLIAFSNLINCYPGVLSIILKFHKKQVNVINSNKKNQISFISFLIRKIFYVMQFYKNCIQSNEKDQTLESLNKERDDARRKLGYEVNSHQSAMESYRNHNIISYFMHGLCYKKKNMGPNETNLVVKARRKVLKEIDDILKEIRPRKEEVPTSTVVLNSNVKNLLTFKITIFCLYTMTEFFDNSHLYHHLNPFEISRSLISQNKDHYEIVGNIIEIMKYLSLSNPFSFSLHRLSTLYISELLKFIRLNPKMNYKNTLRSNKDIVNEAKLLLKTISSSRGDLIIEADILEDENNLNREDGDIIMDEGLDVVDNLINNMEAEDDEEREDSNEQEDESENEDLEDEHEDIEEENEEDRSNSNTSDQELFYSISSSEEEDESESGEISEEDDDDDEDNEEDDVRSESEEEHKEDEGDVIQVNIDAPLVADNLNDEDNEDFDEGEEDYSNEDEYEEEYMINDNEDHPNETSVRFEDEVNEFHNIERDEDSESNSFESEGNIMYGEGRYNRAWGRTRFSLNAFGSRLNNLTSILLNSNDNGNILEDHEDVLFFNPTFEKTGKSENAIYFEENVTFPFMIYLMSDDLTEFTKPGIYISVINKLKKRQLDSLNSIFILRFISPFDRKTKRNLYFALNASKEKVITAYNKEVNKLEVDQIPFNPNDQLRNFSKDMYSLENIKETICKEMGINLKELKELKDDPKQNTNSNENPNEINKKESEKNQHSQNKKESNYDQTGNNNRNSPTSNLNSENKLVEKNKNIEEDLIDPEFLEHIPEDLREDVLQNQKRLMEDNTLVNQYYNPEDIDPDLLNEVNPELMPGVLNSNNNQNNQEASNNLENNLHQNNQNTNQQNEGVNNANIDSATFIYSLPIDIREEILLTSDLNFIRSLPQDLRDEAQRLYALYDPDRLLLMNEDIAGSLNNQEDNDIEVEYYNQNMEQEPFSWLLNPIKENKKPIFTFKPHKYNFEEILSKQKHQKDQTSFIISTLDDDFIEKLIAFNIKFTCESSPKTKINNNQYWVLINNLIQNSNFRYQILDLLFVLWILDSMCLKRLIRENEIELNQNNNFNTTVSANILNKSPMLRYLYELYVENHILEEFFYDDYDQFVKNFCQNYPKEMKKFFLETFYTDKGEYISTGGKKYSISKNITWLKDLLKINFEKDENVLSNLIKIMITNSKSDIKKIFALKIFTNIVTNCVNTTTITEESSKNNLSVSLKTIERVVDLFYNFETVLEINKDKKSNNPTQLLCELIVDDKCFKFLLSVLNNHIENLNKAVSYEMDHFFTDRNIDINVFSKPLPENVLFKIIKLVNQMNVVINKRSEKDEGKAANKIKANNPNNGANIEEENLNLNSNQNVIIDNNQMIVDVPENIIKEDEDKSSVAKSQNKSELIKQELNEFIKVINLKLIKCWEKLDLLLYEITKRMKEDQKIIDPKLNRLIPYLEAFITLSHLQFLPENKGQITLKPFIMEVAYKRTPRKTPQHGYFEIFDDFNEFFVKFCENNKKVINLILRRYPKMFPPEILIKISKFLDLENKKKYFKFELRKLKTGKDHHINLRVRRDHIFMDSYTQLRSKKPDEIRGRLTITFIGEEAVDAGGVKREWFTLLSKEMFNPDYMLFKLAANGNTYMPNSESGMFESDHLELFSFIGKVIAKAIYDGFMLDCYFTRGFYKLICNIPLTYHDMEDVDPQYFKNLKWLLETDISDMGELFTFSYEEDKLGKIEVIDLIPNGRNISVSEENKFDYVQKLCYAKLFDTIKPQMEALQRGFYEIIPLKLISIFDHRELELVISGLPTVDDLKNNTIYENYTTESQIIQWFWSIIDSWDNNERAEFLQFVTGSSKVPLEGFSALQGIGGINKFKISKVFDKNFDRLPTAHTCTNQLDLPDYPSKEILFERINLAIREGKVGFGFI